MTKAPWTEEQVVVLNRFQANGAFHPFTCPGKDSGCERRELTATKDGWVCHCGEYKQDWAHDFMLEVELPKFPWGKV